MSDGTRVVFTFDPATLGRLEAIKERKGYKTLAEALSEAIWTYDTLLGHEDEGFTEIVLRNPRTDRERVMRNRLSKIVKLMEVAHL